MTISVFTESLSLCIQSNIPAMLWGLSGSGKTKSIAAIARALDMKMWPIILSTREPTDQGGYPHVDREAKVVDMLPLRWAKELVVAKRGIPFWDEMNTATTPVQASALRVVDEGFVGDTKLPDETSHVAACMPHEPGSGTNPLIGAMANRWAHFPFNPAPEERIKARREGYPDPVLERIARSAIDEGVDDANMVISLFHEKRPTLIHARPGDVAARSRAWPSDRTWSMAARLISASRVAGHTEKSAVMRMLVKAVVGDGAGEEFFSWWIHMDLKSPEEYFANPNLPLPTRQDQLLVTLGAVAAAAARGGPGNSEGARTAKQRVAFKLIGRTCRELGKPDLCVPAAKVVFGSMTQEIAENLPVDDIAPLVTMLKGAGKTIRDRKAS